MARLLGKMARLRCLANAQVGQPSGPALEAALRGKRVPKAIMLHINV
jgi:hypothetical protein